MAAKIALVISAHSGAVFEPAYPSSAARTTTHGWLNLSARLCSRTRKSRKISSLAKKRRSTEDGGTTAGDRSERSSRAGTGIRAADHLVEGGKRPVSDDSTVSFATHRRRAAVRRVSPLNRPIAEKVETHRRLMCS
jgi:hypothetical protein